jgi:hypothetical protein
MRVMLFTLLMLLIGCSGGPSGSRTGHPPHDDTFAMGGSAGTGVSSGGTGDSSAGGSTSSGGNAPTTGGTGTAGTAANGGSGGVLANGGCLNSGGANSPGGAPVTGEPGIWENVTPDGFTVTDGIGAMDVIVDPVRPQDLYAFATAGTGVWKSTDYATSWTLVSTGTLGDTLAQGRQWAAAIDPNPARDPETPPTLYTANGYGPVQGVFKSTDGGVNWVNYVAAEQGVNVYSLDIDPCDSQHLIAGLHHTPDVIESTDGGETWTRISKPGGSIYVWFVDTGDAATTHDTWLAISEAGTDVPLSRTTDGGQTWSSVNNSLQHAHGASQFVQLGDVLYLAGVFGNAGSGVYRSDDFGASWTHVSPDWGQNGVFATPDYLYTYGGGTDPALRRAALDADTSWSDLEHPALMTYCPKRVAVTNDGQHDIAVSGSWATGFWRYVEP